MKRKPYSLYINFVLFIFLVVTVVSCVFGFTLYLLFRFHHIDIQTIIWKMPASPFIFLVIMRIFSYTIVAAFFGKRVLKPILTLSAGMVNVSKGDFNVQLETDECIGEVNQMLITFNDMVKELKSIEMLRNDFVTNVSHEFKTPLAKIEGYAALLEDPTLTEEDRDQYVAIINKNTKQLTAMTSNILKLSRLENQKLSLKRTHFRLDEQIRQAFLDLENLWSDKEIELAIELPTIEYEGFEELLSHVWRNIIENAIKYTEARGNIWITGRKEASFWIVTVSDNGVGMSQEVLEHIFEKFYQGDHSHHKEGNGLGLALVKKIVEVSEGQISVASKVGEGTTFTVSLPIITHKKVSF